MKYFGTSYHNLDEKNRLSIPAKLKVTLSSKIYILRGFDGCVSVYDENSFDNFVTKINDLSFNQAKERAYIRTLLASVVELIIDAKGRVQLPLDTVKKYNIEKELALIGVGDHLEIWNKDKWESYSSEIDANFEEIAEGI